MLKSTYKTPIPANIQNKVVILRLDLDVSLENGKISDITRLENSLDSLKFCIKNAKKVLILGHLGRPEGRQSSLSLKPVQESIKRLINQDISLINELDEVENWKKSPIVLGMLENIRYWPQEEKPEPNFTRRLANTGSVYINDAFAVSHRTSTSLTELPKYLDSYLGFHFKKELEALDRVVKHPIRPITIILGGKKTDKIENVDNFSKMADNLLIGGALVRELSYQTISKNVILASLTPDGMDISSNSATQFAQIIASSKTIIWNGPMGKFEDEAFSRGTKAVLEAVKESEGFSIIGGGDTLSAINKFSDKSFFDHLSSGGGSLLYYLAHSSLPALEAINSEH